MFKSKSQSADSWGVEVIVMELNRNTPIGTFRYLKCPRIGELVLLSDNDGSGEIVWRVTQVVHFPNSPEIAIHVINSTKEIELVKSYRKYIGEAI